MQPGFSKTPWFLVFLLVIFLAPLVGSREVQDQGEGEPDYRDKVVLAYGLVMGLVIFYLVTSHLKNARLAEEIEFLGRRIEELQKRRE